MEPRINEKNITITLDFDQNIHVFGDKKRIDQVFRILIDNAINYSFENSEVMITATEKPKGIFNLDNIDGTLFQIKDNGRGIPKQDLPHIFERFFRSENAKDVKGSGLGLAIAKHLTELHDGEIFVESNYGEGSTFSVFLPKHQKS
jgi:signal transduction histidine kinase